LRGDVLDGLTAAATVLDWLRSCHSGVLPLPVDLDLVRWMLPGTALGEDIREVKPPVAMTWAGFDGALVRNPDDSTQWGIFYSDRASPQRQRFTVAHELGHLVLHRARQASFHCEWTGAQTGVSLALMEREADDFASHLLMPGDALREGLAGRPVDLHLLSELARRFGVSFEALCLRFIKHTDLTAILLHWDNGYLKYEWRSRSAQQTRIRIRRTGDPQEPLPGTIAANDSVAQHFGGMDLPMQAWCVDAPPQAVVREFKHRYAQRNRVLTLLLLAPIAPVEDPPAGSVVPPLQVAP
jgi:hypothetical protein